MGEERADGGSGPESEREDHNVTAFAPLRLGEFRALWTASLFSNLGSFFQITAGSWLMWELTASPAWVGWMTASRNLPLLLLALPAGVLADRLNRARMLSVTQVAMGLAAGVLAVLTLLGWIGPSLLLALGLILGIGVAFHAPTWQSLVPDLVPRALVTSAVALNSVSFNSARAVGPAIGGILVATVGAAAAFGINSITYLFMAVVILVVGRTISAENHDGSSISRSMITGVRFAAHTRSFRRLLALGTMFALGTAVLQAMLPVRTEELGHDAGAYGLLLGMMGAGAAVGGVALVRLNHRLGENAVPVTIASTGAAGVVMGLAPSLPLAAAAMFGVGVFWLATLANLNSTVQLLSPDWVRGRAVGLWLLAYAGMVPVGAIISGLIAEGIGAGPTVVILSVATMVLGVGARFRGVQDPTSVQSPEFSTARRSHHHPPVEGGPVLIVNTWHIRDKDLSDFQEVMSQVRGARLATGGSRWQMYKDLGEPLAYTEAFVMSSWSEHLQQHKRIDDEVVDILRRARALDTSVTGPVSRHYLGIDINADDVRTWNGVVDSDHDDLHATDGSVPLRRFRRPRRRD